MQIKMLAFYGIVAFAAITGTAHAARWLVCGQLQGIDPTSCQIPGRSLTAYEYDIS